jgi:hypothetical protein
MEANLQQLRQIVIIALGDGIPPRLHDLGKVGQRRHLGG